MYKYNRRKKKDEINVEAKGFLEFRRLVNLCYEMGYHFSKRYGLIKLWLEWDAIGVSITDFESGNYTMKVLDTRELDTISVDEFLKIVGAQI